MEYPSLSHHGGTRGVTGSCHQLHLGPATSLLIDCGLEQGNEAAPGAESAALGFDIQGIQALVVTHVHLDHVGRIPALLAAGYRGPILCSEPSARLLPLVLEDAYKLSISSEPAQVARYIDFIRELIVPLPFERWHAVVECPGLVCRIRLQRAGHLLGSAYVECDMQHELANTRYVFSGDLGACGNPLLRPVQPPERADVLVLESTYGDRLHARAGDRRQRLKAAIDRALGDKGTILIPAFSLGRTRSCYTSSKTSFIARLCWAALVPGLMATRSTGRSCPSSSTHPWLNASPACTGSCTTTGMSRPGRALQKGATPGVQPTDQRGLPCPTPAGGQLPQEHRPACDRDCRQWHVLGWAYCQLPQGHAGGARHEVMFVGYQAKGTPGAMIQAGEGADGVVQIDLDGQMYEVRAKVMTLSGYSAHADQAGLLQFALGGPVQPGKVLLVHGEKAAKTTLKKALMQRAARRGAGLEVCIP